MSDKPEEKGIITKEIKVNRIIPDDLQSYFVSNMVIQHQPDHFILTFYEAWPPAILEGEEEDIKKLIETIDSIDAKCVARLVISPNKMRNFIQAMNDNLEKFEKSFGSE